MEEHFFRCINCRYYLPGNESCSEHNININSELNLCSMHSSGIYKHIKKNILYKVEETLLETILVKEKRISKKREKNILCSRCIKKKEKEFHKEYSMIDNHSSMEERIFMTLMKIIINPSENISDAIFNSELCESEEFQKILNCVEDYNFKHKKISICPICYEKILGKDSINQKNNVDNKIFKLLDKILEKQVKK